jgi:hypothetical protein
MRAAPSLKKRAGTARRVWPLLMAGIAVVLFSSAGFARMMGWGPGAMPVLDAPAGKARAGPRCPECGMIVSVRELERRDEALPASYEFVARMADGSSRVMVHASPLHWRNGERLIVIDATNRPHP